MECIGVTHGCAKVLSAMWYAPTTKLPQRKGSVRSAQVILNVEDGTCTQTDDGKDSAKRPAARFAHAACAVSAGSKQCVYIFGGMGEEADYQDVVSWTPTVGKDDQ